MKNPRIAALDTIQNRKPIEPTVHDPKVSALFAVNVFTLPVMKEYLTEDVYAKIKSAVDHGETLERSVADKVANAMKIWALEKGATHYTHWFQPLTGLTAEKHDAFFTTEKGSAMEHFSGSSLAQQEPDASSLPSGGIRNTFEARGYTAWDPSSPAFIYENRFGKTLCIPTIFVSYTGEALDFKAPLLKSITILEKAAVEVCRLFDPKVNKVYPTLGPEQEYFLVDKAWYELRPDLALTGRTLLGAAPARGQQLEDHYFGSIPERVYGFMKEFEIEATKLGIPLKTRHNEVAPSQFECAPIFEELNIAVDHNALLMDLMDRIARKHNFRVLFHEKPFAGVNGSGKHNNWSMATDTGKNLLSPGNNPKDNLQFLTFFVNTIKAVYDNADLLRASIASAPNDHRLGANEAPPAIISVFIGGQLESILEEVENPSRKKKNDTPRAYLKLGINKIPEILLDNTDRNRTSPFAFTGNKFEFRAVGSSANIGGPAMVLNSIVANQLIEFSKTVERKTSRGKKKETAILEVLREYITACKSILFDGNGYSEDWVKEAKRRGFNNVKTTPRALDFLVTEKSINLFTGLGIFTEVEMHARHEIQLEIYSKKVNIEARVLSDLLNNHVIPAALDYQTDLADNINKMKAAGFKPAQYALQVEMAESISTLATSLHKNLGSLDTVLASIGRMDNQRDIAIVYSDKVMPLMAELRTAADGLEHIVADDRWPLPKYREMLFVR